MVPAHQRLEAADLEIADPDQRLVDQLELPVPDRHTELVLEDATRGRRLLQPRVVQAPRAPARGLDRVQRHVGAGEEQIGLARVPRKGRDANAGADVGLDPGDVERS